MIRFNIEKIKKRCKNDPYQVVTEVAINPDKNFDLFQPNFVINSDFYMDRYNAIRANTDANNLYYYTLIASLRNASTYLYHKKNRIEEVPFFLLQHKFKGNIEEKIEINPYLDIIKNDCNKYVILIGEKNE